MSKIKKEDLKECIDSAIKLLEDTKNKITDENVHHFSIITQQNRPLEPIYYGDKAVGHRQTGPSTLSITIEDNANTGKHLI